MLLSDNAIVEILKNVLMDTKRINANGDECEKHILYVLQMCDKVNSLDELAKSLDNYTLDQVVVPSWAKDFLYPTKVSLGTGWYFNDLVLRPIRTVDTKGNQLIDGQKLPFYDPSEMARAARTIARYYKTDAQLIDIQSSRPGVTPLSSCKFSVGEDTRQEGDELFLPVPLIPDLRKALGESYFNYDNKTMRDQYLKRQFRFDA